MAIFNVKDKFNSEANFSSLKIGADAPVLEVELNELQHIQRERLRQTTKALLTEGIKGQGTYVYENNNLTITNELVLVDGEVLRIDNVSLVANEGESVYIEVWEEEISHLSNIPKFGNISTSEFIPNYLIDDRVGEETSRRVQVQFRVTTQPTKEIYLELGYIERGEFILLANNLNARTTPLGNGVDFTVYSHFVLVSPLGKKFKLLSTYEGELYTVPTKDSLIGVPIVLSDPNNNPWMIVVDEEGRLSTVTVSRCPLNTNYYLQTPQPFAIIYKLEVSVEGELSCASVCEVNIINDEVTTLDKTWSSYKLNQHVLAQDKVVQDLAKEQTEFLKTVISEKDKIIADLIKANETLVNNMTTEKDKILADLRAENERLIKYTEAKINEMVSDLFVMNSPSGTLFQLRVDDEGVLETIEKEVVIND